MVGFRASKRSVLKYVSIEAQTDNHLQTVSGP